MNIFILDDSTLALVTLSFKITFFLVLFIFPLRQSTSIKILLNYSIPFSPPFDTGARNRCLWIRCISCAMMCCGTAFPLHSVKHIAPHATFVGQRVIWSLHFPWAARTIHCHHWGQVWLSGDSGFFPPCSDPYSSTIFGADWAGKAGAFPHPTYQTCSCAMGEERRKCLAEWGNLTSLLIEGDHEIPSVPL